ncbi:MAG: ABC transporter substrate-binding protein [Actinomycetota bacterium]|nr:ABC transporter substrate-binding protein [Actinomycetota bacterium]
MSTTGSIGKKLAVIATVLVLPGLAACGSSNSKSAGGGGDGNVVKGGTLITASTSTSGILNPGVTTNGLVHGNSELMFNGLLAWSKDNQIVGDLAEKFVLSPDGKQADFTLRPGMTWHDGKPIMAEDVDFSFREALLRYQGRMASSVGAALGVTGSGNTAVTPPEAITMPDGPSGLTVRFTFRTPYFPLFRQMNVTEAAIIPKHVYEPCSVAAMGEKATLGNATGEVCAANNTPVGSGPFKFGTRDATKIEFNANKAYHIPDLPYLDRVVFFVVNNVQDALQANRSTSGSVDVGTIQANALSTFQSNSAYTVTQIFRGGGGSNCVTTIGLNLWPKGMSAPTIAAKPADSPYESPYFADVAVRKAIFTAVDRTGMWKKIVFGQGKLATSPYASQLPGYRPQPLPGDDAVNNDADTAAANAQLDAAGWKDTNGNGTRDKGGVELAFDITHFDTGTAPDFGRQFVADMAKIGIAVTDRPLTNAAQQQSLADRTYDTVSYENCNGDDAVIGVKRQYASSDIRVTAFSNIAGYHQSAMDALWDKAASTAGQENDEVNTQIQKMAVDDVPYIWILETASNRVSRATCQGFNNQNTGLSVETAWCGK